MEAQCKACGSALETTERQLRAADEATQTVTSCPSCPVKAWMINVADEPSRPPRVFRHPVTRKVRRFNSVSGPKREKRYEVAFSDYGGAPGAHAATEKHIVVKRKIEPDIGVQSVPRLEAAAFTVSGPRPGTCELLTDVVTLGFGVVCKTYSLCDSDEVTEQEQLLLAGNYCETDAVADRDCIFYVRQGSTTGELVVNMGEQLASDAVRVVIDATYGRYGMPAALQRYFEANFLSHLETISPRAWDTSVAPTSGYSFTCKPDGERCWLFLRGRCWYMAKKRKPYVPVKWKVCAGRPEVEHPAIVVDAEHVLGTAFLLIDCLTDHLGKVSPVSRDMAWVHRTFKALLSIEPSCPVVVRSYFRSPEAAASYCLGVPYPTDGVVAIRDGSTEALKVKNIKSMELEHRGAGRLFCSDGAQVVVCGAAARFDPGTVVELRFSAARRPGAYTLHEVFPRPDKAGLPNSSSAVANILHSTRVEVTEADHARRKALIWCNELRNKLHQRGLLANQSKHIVLDVGTGSGQAVGFLLGHTRDYAEVSYVLLEPDAKKCAELSARLRHAEVLTDPTQLVPLVRQLKSRSRSHAILNCALGDLMRCSEAREKLMPELRCVHAVFSLQYVVEEVHDLVNEYGTPVYGCCYVYDNVDSSGVLVDSCGVHMQVAENGVATVRWGRDAKYEEPAITSREIYGIGVTIRGVDFMESLNDASLPSPDDHGICANVFVAAGS